MTKKLNWKIIGLAGGLVILMAGALFFYYNGSSPVSRERLTEYSSGSIAEANNLFAFDFYDEIKGEDGNIFFSPFSMVSAFAMVYDGARGQTAEELKYTFHLPGDIGVVRSEYADLNESLNAGSEDYELRNANAFWAKKDYPFLGDYLAAVRNYYGGELRNLDFGNSAASSKTINDWVKEKTNGKITDLIPPSAINGDTRAILTNAIYFKGTWVKRFNEEDTREENFKTDNDGTVKVQMMSRTDNRSVFGYEENGEYQALEAPYSGDDLTAVFLLPKDGNIDKLASSFDAEKFAGINGKLEEQRVDVYIPRFKFETQYTMSGILKKMGLGTAFSDAADFSGMTGNNDLKIDEAIHKAFVEVNEEGTEAAAATGIVVGITSAMPEEEPKIPEFRADHPFLFIIQHKPTGTILFLGRVSNPNL